MGIHRTDFTPGAISIETTDLSNSSSDDPVNYLDDSLSNFYASTEYAIYLNDNWTLSKNTQINWGARAALFSTLDYLEFFKSDYPLIQSKFFVNQKLSSKLSFSAGIDQSMQAIHTLTTADVGFPNEMWVPSTSFIEPQQSWQTNLGLAFTNRNNFRFRINAYYKELSNLIRFPESSTLPSLYDQSNTFWEQQITKGSGTSKGIEFEFNYSVPKTTLNLNYTLSKSTRQFEEIENNEVIPYEFDQRHAIAFNCFQKITKKIQFYLNWKFSSGLPLTLYNNYGLYTPMDSFFQPPNEKQSKTNALQLPDYHRLDLGFVFNFKNDLIHQEVILGVQNVYDRTNLLYQYYATDIEELEGRGALPILPTLKYKVGF